MTHPILTTELNSAFLNGTRGREVSAATWAQLNRALRLDPPPPISGQLSRNPPPDGLRTPAERGTSKQAAAILGLKPRKLQTMSARGEIPGAAKLGRQWTYDLAKLRRFVEQREQACQDEKPRPDATGADVSFGPKLWSAGGASGGRLKQMIRQSQRRADKQARRAR
jgi:hypothetical protein